MACFKLLCTSRPALDQQSHLGFNELSLDHEVTCLML